MDDIHFEPSKLSIGGPHDVVPHIPLGRVGVFHSGHPTRFIYEINIENISSNICNNKIFAHLAKWVRAKIMISNIIIQHLLRITQMVGWAQAIGLKKGVIPELVELGPP